MLPLCLYAETPSEYKAKDDDYSIEAAQDSLKYIEEALNAFRDFSDIVLTDEVIEKIKSDSGPIPVEIKSQDFEKISKNVNWATQNIGFKNWVIIVRGMLLKNNYINKKLEYELAMCNSETTDLEKKEMKKNFEEALTKYQDFLSETVYSD